MGKLMHSQQNSRSVHEELASDKAGDVTTRDAHLAYVERCRVMVRSLGLNLGASAQAWLKASERFSASEHPEWRIWLISVFGAPSQVLSDTGRSEFIYISTRENLQRAALGGVISSVRQGDLGSKQFKRPYPHLICRATEEEARKVHVRIRHERHAASWHQQCCAPWVVDGCEYLAGTPEQLGDWCGNIRAGGYDGVHLDFFEYLPQLASRQNVIALPFARRGGRDQRKT